MKLKFNGFLALLLVLITQITFAQDMKVSGVVQDQAGLPIPGVNVLVKGTSNGVQTDFDGKFQLTAAQGDILVFSFLGMKTVERPASANMTVKMTDDSVQLEGVVVTALGIKREKKALGYAATSVNRDQLTTVTTNNPIENLSGKIAGVDISAPAQPGSSTKVILRGFGSISGTNQPLYVVDGTPINNSSNGSTSTTRSYDAGSGINDLDPNNIESVTFLKGAAATALYGSRAGRGAIIITTRKGKNQSKINVDFLSSMEFSEVARVPHLQNQFGQGWGGEGFSQISGVGAGPSNENGSWGPAFNGEIRPWGTVYNSSQQIKPYVAMEGNLRDFYTTGLMHTNSINISGGNDLSDFSLNFTNVDSDGVIPTDADRYRKRALAFNGGLKNKKFSLRTSINYTNKDQNAVNTGQGDDAGEGSTVNQDLLQIPRDISIVDLQDYRNNPFNSPSYYFTPYATNPYFAINENSTKIVGNNIFGNTNLNYNFTDNFSATWQIGGNYRNEAIKSHGAIVDYLEGSPQALAAANEVVGGVTESRIERTEFDTYFNLNYNKNIGESFKLALLGGINYNQRTLNQLQTLVTGLGVPNFYELTNSANRPEVTQQNSLRRTLGIYGQAEVSFKERVYLTVTARSDQTSTLPTTDNRYFYPSASLSGIVLDNGKHYVKVRGAISRVGNDTDPYFTENSLISGTAAANFGTIDSPIGGVPFFEASGVLGNPELKPEMTTETELGIESTLFNKRVTIDLSLYHRKTEDLIANILLDPSVGYASQSQNIGTVENKGIELALGLTPVKTDDFSWDLNYTFTKNENEMTEVNGDTRLNITSAYGITFAAEEGRPLGSFYGFVPKMTAAGQYIVNDRGMYVQSDDVEYIGDTQRKFVMGLQNTLKYKNMALSFGIDWKEGGKMYSYTKRLSHFVGNGIETTYNDRNPFIVPNSVMADPDNEGQFIENTNPVSWGDQTYFWNTSDNPAIERTHIIDRTFVRLRDVSFTYAFNQKIVERLGLSRFSIGVYGRNLFLWTPDENPYVDPETTSYGNELLSEFGEFGTNPSQRSYGCTVKLSF